MFTVTLPDGRAVSTDDFEEFTVSLGGVPLSMAYVDDTTGEMVGPAWVLELVKSPEVWRGLVRQSEARFSAVPDADRAEMARRAALN